MVFGKIAGLLFVNIIFFSSILNAGPNDSNLTEHEQTQQDLQKNRQEIQNSGVQSNPSVAPAKINLESWNIQSNAQFEITNHFFGYSLITDKDTEYDGVKLTGFLNIALYAPRKNNDGLKKKSMFVVGIEEPIFNINNRLAVFCGGGLVLGQAMGMYLNAGVDFYIFPWLKTQIGANYISANGHISPQLNAGFSW